MIPLIVFSVLTHELNPGLKEEKRDVNRREIKGGTAHMKNEFLDNNAFPRLKTR
jgi:hypothetical protein